jgi:glycosyltransferase involved in cell wall biosynthesis
MLFGPPVIEWLAARLLRRPLLLDLDDATYIAAASPVYGRVATLLKWPGKTDRLIRWARTVICGNPNIADYAQARGVETAVIPAVVDTRVFFPRTPPSSDVPTIGWIGTHTTFPFLRRLLPLFERLGRERRFCVRIIGSGRDDIRFDGRFDGVEIETRAWDIGREAEDFRSLDIGVYPLDDDAWNAGKSGLKAVQYMASGVPFVMSPVGVCAAMGRAGETNFAAVTDDEWLDALRRLLDDEELRRKMGQAGRAFAERWSSIDGAADSLAAIIKAAVPLRRPALRAARERRE